MSRTTGMIIRIVFGILPVLLVCSALAQTAHVKIDASKPGVRISSNLFGIFFEEINFAGDGGIYAELVRNRSFEEPGRTNSWQFVASNDGLGSMAPDNSLPAGSGNSWSVMLTKTNAVGSVGLVNSGFWGMNLQAGKSYQLSFLARASNGFTGSLTIRLENGDGTAVLGQAGVAGLSTDWKRFTVNLVPATSDPAGRLAIVLTRAGTVWLDMISLFPKETYLGRTNGMRPDLANMLEDLNPAFMRFPGGCWVEGEWMTNAYRWKTTIGDPASRATRWNLWQYYSNNGLGYHEYLQLCEDLGAKALFVINCGMSHNEVVPMAQMGEYVQDALDAIEYANGPASSYWGSIRAANGHPEPFNLAYIQIGNENGGSAYNERYALFYDAIKAAYPGIAVIANNWNGTPNSRPLEIVDEHYYSDPAFFINNASKYDTYNRNGPRIYVGEYAVTSGNGNGNLRGALAEAAFMTGMERNADVVVMGSYAPLFANLNYKRWNPDLIYFDSSRVAPTPSYHVQRMFANHRGDVVLPVTVDANVPEPAQLHQGAVGLGSWNTQVEYTNVVVTRDGETLFQSDFTSGATNWQVYRGSWSTSGGTYRQTAMDTDCRTATGSTTWSNYTLRVRARKTSGQEGFLILFNWLNNDNWTWWNLGGWNNTRHAIENCENGSKSVLGSQVNGSIENGRWYDIRIELNARNIRCFLDDQLVQEASYRPPQQGAIGVGTWSTRASFTNVVVTRAAQTLYQADFASGAAGWTTYGGTWSTENGLYRQTSLFTNCRSTSGDTNWSDYTLRLRARKDGGNEGFLILFNWLNDNNWTWWNIGGWNNTGHAIEVNENGTKRTLSSRVPGSIETGRWYDIRVELSGSRIRCFLDDQLVHDLSYSTPKMLHASASYHEATGQVVLKMVNVSSYEIAGTIDLQGIDGVDPKANWTLLTSGSMSDENTLDQPDKVSPISGTLANASTNFVHLFPGNSLTVLRLQNPAPETVRVGLAVGTNLNDLALYPKGIPVVLDSFITGPVSVDYVFEDASGAAVVSGKLEFSPGDTVLPIPVPQTQHRLLRLTLQNPVGCVLGSVHRAYFAATETGGSMTIQTAAYADESLVYWTTSAATLMTATNLAGSWMRESNTLPPLRIPRGKTLEFFRLAK